MLVMLDGSDPKAAPFMPCPLCGKAVLRVFTTAGARRVDPSLPPHQDACINANWKGPIPCPRALASKGLLDRLIEASRS